MEDTLKTRAKGKTILIVDDEPSIVEVLDFILTDAGFSSITAEGVTEALARLEECNADLVLTDYMMPLRDGYELIKAIRANPKFAEIPIILASGLQEEIVSARCDGYQAFVSKPYKAEPLIELILHLVESDPRK